MEFLIGILLFLAFIILGYLPILYYICSTEEFTPLGDAMTKARIIFGRHARAIITIAGCLAFYIFISL